MSAVVIWLPMKLLAAFVVTLLPAVALAQDTEPPPYAQQPPPQAAPQAYPPPQQYPPAGQPQQQEPPPYGQGQPQQGGDPQYGAQPQGGPDEIPQGGEQGPQYGFVGPHPEPVDSPNRFCYIEGPHFHEYPPFDQYLFRQLNGYFYFVGDPSDFGYTGQMWGYQGNHPIPVENGGGYCYINWPHRHAYPAPASMAFRYVGGYYNYYGPWDPIYYTNRSLWLGYYGGYYRNSYYGGRYWTVRPAPIYRGVYGYGHPGVYRPGMTVVRPGGGTVVVGRPGGGYGRPGGGVYVAPGGRPGGGVYVAPGGRPGGGVYVAPGGARPGYNNPGARPAEVNHNYERPAAQPAPARQAAPVQRQSAPAPSSHKRH